jgi:hypothetical protein
LQDIADANGGNRAAGTAGYDRSADYVAARLRGAGYQVRFEELTFFGGTAGRPYDPYYHRACDTAGNVSAEVLEQMTAALVHTLGVLGADGAPRLP